MRAWPWIVGGGALAYAVTRKRGDNHASRSAPPVVALAGRWVWPVARWNGRAPVISDGFDSPRPGAPRHGGVDIMFARVTADQFKAGTPNGSTLHVMPDGIHTALNVDKGMELLRAAVDDSGGPASR